MARPLCPARIVSPGKILRRELDARRWTQKDLAHIMGRPEQAISEIVNGNKQITPETAHELAAALNTSPEFWQNLESNYRLNLAKKQAQTETIARKSSLYQLLPLKELVKRSWIKKHESVDEMEKEVIQFLNVSSIDEVPSLVANFRQSTCKTPQLSFQLAWVKRVEQLARQQTIASFDLKHVKQTLPTLLELSSRAEDIAHVPNLFTEIGIHFVILNHLPKTYLDGALLYVDNNPIIALTLRYDRIDSFWFTLMHELGHLIEQHSGIFLDNIDDLAENEQELSANRFAENWLIPSDEFNRFIIDRRYFSKMAIEDFAKSINRHPGIVLGHLHYNNLVPYKNLRQLLVKVSPYLHVSK